MATIGKMNKLKVTRELEFGVHLDGGELGPILLPASDGPWRYQIGDVVDVFIYFDSEDRLIATTWEPLVMINECALLEVSQTNNIGAFMDWGLPKDLLVPFREQKQKMEMGKSYIVFVYLDEKSNRLAASARLNRFLGKSWPDFQIGQEVDVLIQKQTDIGHAAIISNTHWGMIYKEEIFRPLRYGEKTKAYIKKVREDGKIDLILDKPGYEKIGDIAENILNKLKQKGGFIPLTDKSSPESIYRMFGVSKKTFKKAIGALYKKRLITIEKDGIRKN